MPTEIIESKQIYRGFIALRLATLRLADGARVSREIIQHGKAAVALPDGRPVRCRHARACLCRHFNALKGQIATVEEIAMTAVFLGD
jgi:hypothetical protein